MGDERAGDREIVYDIIPIGFFVGIDPELLEPDHLVVFRRVARKHKERLAVTRENVRHGIIASRPPPCAVRAIRVRGAVADALTRHHFLNNVDGLIAVLADRYLPGIAGDVQSRDVAVSGQQQAVRDTLIWVERRKDIKLRKPGVGVREANTFLDLRQIVDVRRVRLVGRQKAVGTIGGIIVGKLGDLFEAGDVGKEIEQIAVVGNAVDLVREVRNVRRDRRDARLRDFLPVDDELQLIGDVGKARQPILGNHFDALDTVGVERHDRERQLGVGDRRQLRVRTFDAGARAHVRDAAAFHRHRLRLRFARVDVDQEVSALDLQFTRLTGPGHEHDFLFRDGGKIGKKLRFHRIKLNMNGAIRVEPARLRSNFRRARRGAVEAGISLVVFDRIKDEIVERLAHIGLQVIVVVGLLFLIVTKID